MLAGTPSITDMIHPDDRQRISDETTGYTENGLNTYIQEFRLLTHDQEIIRIESRTIVQRDAAGQAMFYDSVLTDITERHNRQEKITSTLAAQRQLNKRLEEAHNQLLQSEKMASIGLLAAGIAHELNNPIGFVHSNLGTLDGYLRDVMDIMDRYEQCASRLDEEAPERVAVNKIKEERDYHYVRQDIFNLLSESKDGLSRVRKIVQDLKSFSHVGEQEWQEANLHQGIDSTLNIVWNELKYKCTVKKNYADLPPVYCLISQLNQVFMNVLVNAGHAIEKSGEINIRTQLYENNNVLIEICDTGKGIAPEHLDRIFDPFFTTKPVGKGTGLGLSLSYSIIERHHGRIEVSSEVGKGTCFRIIIPIEQATTGEKPTVMENPS
jgi:signal transduction histidine kinase